MTTPKISVLVAAYNSDAYLELALRDALSQNFVEFEVIVSDDAASRETQALVERFSDSRLKYRSNGKRLGAAGNHRAALAVAEGEFITILNHDDRWYPEFLDALIRPLAKDGNLGFAFCDHRVIDAEGLDVPGQADILAVRHGRTSLLAGRQDDVPNLFLSETIPLAMGTVFRRELINHEDLPVAAGPAYDLWIAYLLVRSLQPGYYVPERHTAWREHVKNQTTAGSRDWMKGAILCWECALSDPSFSTHCQRLRMKIAAGHRSLAIAETSAGQNRAARRAALNALKACPLDYKSALLFGLQMTPPAVSDRILRHVKRRKR